MIQYGTFRSLLLGCFVQNPPSLLQSPSKFCFHCCCSVAKSCVDCSTSGFPILHYLQVCSDLCPLSQWCHPAISSSVALITSCLQSLPASGSFPMSQLFASGGQSIKASASASVLPMNIQDWFPLGLTGWISLLSKDSQESSPAPQFKSIDSLVLSLHYGPTLTSVCDYCFHYLVLWFHNCRWDSFTWRLGHLTMFISMQMSRFY